jgi:hypothetical protein
MSNKNQDDFFRIAQVGTCIGLGFLGGLFGSLGGIGANFTLHFGIGTLVGAAIGVAVGWGVWRIVRRKTEEAERKGE